MSVTPKSLKDMATDLRFDNGYDPFGVSLSEVQDALVAAAVKIERYEAALNAVLDNSQPEPGNGYGGPWDIATEALKEAE